MKTKTHIALVSLAASAAVPALVLSACSGNDEDSTAISDVDKLASCLNRTFEVDPDAESIYTPGVGYIEATSETQHLELWAERTVDDAEDTAGKPFLEDAELHGTVVVLWDNEPTDEEAAALKDCLADQGVA